MKQRVCVIFIYFIFVMGDESSKRETNCSVRGCSDNANFTMNCEGMNLSSILRSLPDDVKYLDLSGNNFSDFNDDGLLRKLKDLRVVNLRNNGLRSFSWRQFPESVEVLDLSHNNISQVCIAKG
jgi:Leucine-rich repeat (LRR) protein